MTVATQTNRYLKSISIVSCFILLACQPASRYSQQSDADCDRPKGWHDGRVSRVVSSGEYNSIYVGKDFYKINGYKTSDSTQYTEYLSKLKELKSNVHQAPIYVFLFSDKNLQCDRYLESAKALEESQQCILSKTCIWGYAMGENATPVGVPRA